MGYSEDGTYMLKVLRESGGAAVAVPDDEILRATRLMVEAEGLYAEPTAAAAAAGAAELRRRGTIGPEDDVVVVSTGHGLKQPFVSAETLDSLPEIGPSLAALSALDLDA